MFNLNADIKTQQMPYIVQDDIVDRELYLSACLDT